MRLLTFIFLFFLIIPPNLPLKREEKYEFKTIIKSASSPSLQKGDLEGFFRERLQTILINHFYHIINPPHHLPIIKSQHCKPKLSQRFIPNLICF